MNIIKDLEKFNISRTVLARLLGTSEVTIGRWQKGQNKPSEAELNLLQSILTIAKKAKNDDEVKESLDGILTMASSSVKGPGQSWISKWGYVLGAAGLLGVVTAIFAAVISNDKK
ncbi:MAG: hypothetical protein ABII90_03850 [Bacteroidota bacterium]